VLDLQYVLNHLEVLNISETCLLHHTNDLPHFVCAMSSLQPYLLHCIYLYAHGISTEVLKRPS
jgi:hypothetical protein